MPTFAAVDVGSNSCRLKIAKVVAHQLKTLAEDREVTRLGASVFESGLISPEAMAATLRALKRFQRAVQAHGVDQIRVVSTSAMRDARNAAAFQGWVKAETGWNLEVISGLEEGRLIHLGVMGGEPGVGGRCLLVDLGGGSCEITLSERKRIRETISVPLGAVRLTEEFLTTDPAPEEGLARMRQWIARELRRAHRKIQPNGVSAVIATSGTAAALAEAAMLAGKTGNGKAGRIAAKLAAKSAAKKATRSLQPLTAGRSGAASGTGFLTGLVSTREVRKLAGRMAKMSLPEREAVPGIGPRRAEIIVAGAKFSPSCSIASACRGSATRRWDCETASWRRCWRSGTCGPRPTRNSSTSAGRACWPPPGGTEWIPGSQNRFAPTPCSFSAS